MKSFKLTSMQIAEIINGITSRIPRPDGSFPDVWCDLDENRKALASAAVVDIYQNSHETPEDFHNLWMRPLLEEGWTRGEFSKENKTHPCMVSFDELPESEILKDEIWVNLTQLFRPYYTENDEESADLC